jgi:hypothetical protein
VGFVYWVYGLLGLLGLLGVIHRIYMILHDVQDFDCCGPAPRDRSVAEVRWPDICPYWGVGAE